MQSGTISSAVLSKFGRLDASFALMVVEHAPLIEELLTKLTEDELRQLAVNLPFDHKAADAVYPLNGHWTPSHFFDRISSASRLTDVAVYVAAASRGVASKILEEVLELSRQKEAKLRALAELLKMAKDKGAFLLHSSVRGK